MVENDSLGPGGCFGTALDQLGWIRSILEEKLFSCLKPHFEPIFASKFLNGMVLSRNGKSFFFGK